MTREKKIAEIITLVSKLFLANGREPTTPVLETFCELLIDYDIKCLQIAINNLILFGDNFPSVSKIIDSYREVYESSVWEMFKGIIDKLEKGIANNKELEIFREISRRHDYTQEELATDFNENYTEHKFKKFLSYMAKINEKEIKYLEHDLLRIEDGQNTKQIGLLKDN